MKQRPRTVLVGGVAALVVIALTTAGVVTLRGGLEERRNANLLAAPDSALVSAAATVKSASGLTDWAQMPVLFDTVEGTGVQTMVWTRHAGVRFDAGDAVEVEYVSGHPKAARLVGEQAGPARFWGTIATGAGILLAMLVLVVAWGWDARAGRLQRRQPLT